MLKLMEFKGKRVFLKEYQDGGSDKYHLKAEGEYFSTEEAIRYLGVRKCINMPAPLAYVDETLQEELDIADIPYGFCIDEETN